jgi:hypothetical protein
MVDETTLSGGEGGTSSDRPERHVPLLVCVTCTPYLHTRLKGFAGIFTGTILHPSSTRRPHTVRRYGLRPKENLRRGHIWFLSLGGREPSSG